VAHDPNLWPYENALKDVTALVKSLPAGARLPGERVLSEKCGVARNTLRRALADLEEQGLLVVSKGRGRFVAGAEDEGASGHDDASPIS